MTEFGCTWDSALLLIFSPNVDPLIYYSHLGPMIAALLLGSFLLFNNRKALVNRTLFFVTIMFAIWTYFDLILWASPTPQDVMFFWSAILPVELLIYAGSLYLVYLFANSQKDISFKKKILIALPFIPLIVFLPTVYAVTGLSPDCDEGAIEGPVIQYMYLFEFVYIIWVALVATRGAMLLKEVNERKQMFLVGTGAVLLLLVFSFGNITLIFALDPAWEQYKLFGMPVFVAFIAYSIIKFKTFNTKLIATQALVAGIAVLIGARLFYSTTTIGTLLSAVTLGGFLVSGTFLVRSVKREIAQREELAIANKGQENLIHIMNHQIKGYLATARDIFAELLEGTDYGAMPEASKPLLAKGLEEMGDGVEYVQGILKGNSAHSGTVQYDLKPLDLKALIAELASKQKGVAEKAGLSFVSTIAEDDYAITGDAAMLEEAFKNLITNAIKYNNPNGSVAVSLARAGGKILFSVKDTGIGISKDDEQNLFKPGGMGKDSIKHNVESSGFGLALVKPVVEKHRGRVWYASNSPEQGTTFFVELPA